MVRGDKVNGKKFFFSNGYVHVQVMPEVLEQLDTKLQSLILTTINRLLNQLSFLTFYIFNGMENYFAIALLTHPCYI